MPCSLVGARCLVALVGLVALSILVIHGRGPRLVNLGFLLGMAIRAVLSLLVNLLGLCVQVVIVTQSGLISLICLGQGLGPARP